MKEGPYYAFKCRVLLSLAVNERFKEKFPIIRVDFADQTPEGKIEPFLSIVLSVPVASDLQQQLQAALKAYRDKKGVLGVGKR